MWHTFWYLYPVHYLENVGNVEEQTTAHKLMLYYYIDKKYVFAELLTGRTYRQVHVRITLTRPGWRFVALHIFQNLHFLYQIANMPDFTLSKD